MRSVENFLKRGCLAFLSLILALPVLAQDTRGRVQGSVSDSSGGVLPGVAVTLQNDATGIATTVQTNARGRYLFGQVDSGTYTVTAKLDGFATVIQKNVRLLSRGDVTADLILKVSGLEETVTVIDSPVAIQFNSTQRDLTLEASFIRELPLATRNPATLAQLDPSVNGDYGRTANFDHYAANAYDIGGRTAGQNDILIDGSAVTNSAKLAYNPSVDAVAEYSIIQNAVDAEYGHSAGGIVTMTTKSGSNDIKGSLYYFGGDPSLNAWSNRITRQHGRNTFWNGGGSIGMPIKKNKLFMFTTFEKQTDASYRTLNYTLPTERERRGDFSQSFNANGTLKVIYDPLTSRNVNGVIVRDPFPGNVIPANRWDPVASKILANLWMPKNAPDNLTGLNNYKYDDYRYYRYFNASTRLDWQINERWKAFGRFSLFKTDQPANNYVEENGGTDPLKMRRTEGSERNGLNFALDTVYTINSNTIVTVRGSFYQTVDRRNYPEMNVGEEGYKGLWPNEWYKPYLAGRPLVYFPNISTTSNGDAFGVRNFWWQQPEGSSLSARLNKNFNSHLVKVGTDVRLKRGDAARFFFANLGFTPAFTQNTTSGASAATGHEWASFLLGAVEPSNSNVQFVPLQEANTEMYAVYIQDDFKVNNKLTLNLGLRYEYEGGYWDSQNRLPQRLDLTDPIPGMQAAIDPKMASLLAGNTGKTVSQLMSESRGAKSFSYNGAFYFTEEGNKRATDADKKQFMPRIGAAYRVDDKTALRAGYGRFYTPVSLTDSGNEPLGQYNLSSFSPTTPVNPALGGVPQAYLANPFPQGLTPAYGKSYGRYTNLGDAVTIGENERRPPVSDRITLSAQREIWGRTVVDVTYLMNFVKRDLLTVNVNLADPRLSRTYGAALSASVPNPFFNYGTVETFPGSLRRSANVTLGSLLRPYPQYGDINQTFTDLGASRFNSLQIRLQKPFSKGFSFVASYAYNTGKSKVFYDNDDMYDRKLTWQDSNAPKHRIVVSGAFEVPLGSGRKFGKNLPKALDFILGGWHAAGTYTYRGGQYLSFGAMVAPAEVKKLGGTGREAYWFDIAGFTTLPAFTRRSNPVQYSNLTGPAYKNLDAALSKRYSLPRDMKIEFRLEAYNALNQLLWANPNTTIGSSDFGRSIAIQPNTAGRRLQYALRLEF